MVPRRWKIRGKGVADTRREQALHSSLASKTTQMTMNEELTYRRRKVGVLVFDH